MNTNIMRSCRKYRVVCYDIDDVVFDRWFNTKTDALVALGFYSSYYGASRAVLENKYGLILCTFLF